MRVILKLINQVYLCVLVVLLIVSSQSVFAVNYFFSSTYFGIPGYQQMARSLSSTHLYLDYMNNVVFIETIAPQQVVARFCTGYVISRDDILTSSDCVQLNNRIAPIFIIFTEFENEFDGVSYSPLNGQLPKPFFSGIHSPSTPQQINNFAIRDIYLIPGARLAILSGHNTKPLYPNAERVELTRDIPDHLFFESQLNDQYIIGFDGSGSGTTWYDNRQFDIDFNVLGGAHFLRQPTFLRTGSGTDQQLTFNNTNWLTQSALTGQHVNALMVGGFNNGGPIVSRYFDPMIDREVISLVGAISFSNVAVNRTLTYNQSSPLLLTPQTGRYVLFDLQTINVINQIIARSATAIPPTPRGGAVGLAWRI